MLSQQPIRVALIDDHVLFREGLRRALEADGTMEVIGELTTVEQALRFCGSGPKCELALIDYELAPGNEAGSGLDVLRALRTTRPGVRAIVVTGGIHRDAAIEAHTQLGASIFLKTEPLEALLEILRRTMQGEAVVSRAAQRALDSEEDTSSIQSVTFSPRELLVLRLITEGLANKEIADRVEVSEANVKAIIQRLFLKTGVRSRSQLVRYVFEFNVELT